MMRALLVSALALLLLAAAAPAPSSARSAADAGAGAALSSGPDSSPLRTAPLPLEPNFLGKWWKKFKKVMQRILDFIDGLFDDLNPKPGDTAHLIPTDSELAGARPPHPVRWQRHGAAPGAGRFTHPAPAAAA